MNETVIIDLFGEEYKFKPDNQVKNPEKVVQDLKQYIKQAESLFQNNLSGKNKIVVLLLAAMNLSKDFHELKLEHSELEKEMNNRISSLIEKIDKEIKKS